MPRLTFWFELASTYSYLSAMRIGPLACAAGVEVVWCPFLLGPIFQTQGWSTSPFNLYQAKGENMWRDMERQQKNMAWRRLRGRRIFRKTAYWRRGWPLSGLTRPGVQISFARSFRLNLQMADIADEVVLSECLTTVGQDGASLIKQAKTDQSIKDQLRQTTEDAQASGLFGAPSFTTDDGELFWGGMTAWKDAIEWALA